MESENENRANVMRGAPWRGRSAEDLCYSWRREEGVKIRVMCGVYRGCRGDDDGGKGGLLCYCMGCVKEKMD